MRKQIRGTEMNKNYTLKELADIGAKAGHSWERDWSISTNEAFTKAILDAIGYEFPKDEEREAFERWRAGLVLHPEEAAFEAWRAGREELRKESCSVKCGDAKPKEPAWIPWEGGECPLGDGVKEWEGRMRNGIIGKAFGNGLGTNWTHTGHPLDIVAYRVWEV